MRLIWPLLASLFLAGCGVGLVTNSNTYSTKDVVTLSRPATNFVSVVSEIGTSQGYKVTATDPTANSVTLSANSNMVGMMTLGKYATRTLTASLMPGGRTVELQISMMGNMSTASQQKAEERLRAFKAALAERFR